MGKVLFLLSRSSTMKFLLVLMLAAVCSAQTWQLFKIYTAASCSTSDLQNGVLSASYALKLPTTCNAQATSFVNGRCFVLDCQTNAAAPVIPSGVSGYVLYQGAGCNADDMAFFYGVGNSGTCHTLLDNGAAGGISASFSCNGGTLSGSFYSSSTDCSGQAASVSYSGACQSVGGVSYQSTCLAQAGLPPTTATNVTLTVTFSAALTAQQIVALKAAVGQYAGADITVSIPSVDGSTEITIILTGPGASIVGRTIAGNLQFNAQFFNQQAAGVGAASNPRLSAAPLTTYSALLLLAALLLATFF